MIAFEGVRLRSPEGAPLLEGLSFRAELGDVVLLSSPSGSGKAAVLRLVAGLLEPDGGRVRVDARGPGEMAAVQREGGLVSTLTLRENVRLPLLFKGRPGAPDEVERRVEGWLDRFGLLPLAELRPYQVHLKDRRLAQWARAFALEPRVLLLEEPLLDVDPSRHGALVGLLLGEGRGERVALVATKDPASFKIEGIRSVLLEAP